MFYFSEKSVTELGWKFPRSGKNKNPSFLNEIWATCKINFPEIQNSKRSLAPQQLCTPLRSRNAQEDMEMENSTPPLVTGYTSSSKLLENTVYCSLIVGHALHCCLKKNQNAPIDLLSISQTGEKSCCCCCLHIKNRSDLYSVPSNILVQLTRTPSVVTGWLPQKGTYYEKSKRNKRTQKSQYTRDNWKGK